MSDQANPYAAPKAASMPGAPPVTTTPSLAGLWRENYLLVMHKDAALPNICVKSGVPVTQPGIQRKFSWHHPALALLILLSPLIYIIVALVASKKANVVVPLSPIEREKRSTGMKIGWGLGLTGLAMFIGGIVLIANANPNQGSGLGVILLISGILLALIGLVYGANKAKIMSPTKITATHAWFKGVHPNILNQLPDAKAM